MTFIDLGGMGNKTDKTDVQRLSQACFKTNSNNSGSGEFETWGVGDAGKMNEILTTNE